MSLRVAILALGFTLGGSATASAQQSRSFDFLGGSPEVVITTAPEADCTTTGDEISCYDYEDIAGARAFVGRKWYKGRLYSVYGSFNEGFFPTISEAFSAKYGRPSKTETKEWQSRGGVKRDNLVQTWTFKTGTLDLESVGGKIGEGRFFFLADELAPPKAPPKVNF